MPRSFGDRLVGFAAHEHEEDFQSRSVSPAGSSRARSRQAAAGGSEHRVDSFRVEPLFGAAPHGETC